MNARRLMRSPPAQSGPSLEARGLITLYKWSAHGFHDRGLVDGRTPVACGLPSRRIRPGGERMTLPVEMMAVAFIQLLRLRALG
jgi:hypothetical protein